jgi:tetratricopeptide (TPR) repeat protein
LLEAKSFMDEDKQKKIILADAVRCLPWLLVLAGAVAYYNSFSGPFVYDDKHAILENPHIRTLWPLSNATKAPPQSPVSARPIVSLTLAINYAISKYDVWSYHLFNLLIHLLAGVTLYGIIKRTLLTEPLKEKFAKHASILAWAAAAIWLVHPVQTDSVTYVIQRTESLMGLFYLLTLYLAIRAMQENRNVFWVVLSVICCALGMATKEVMVTAPLIVLLYDRTFASGSFLYALKRRRVLYLGLAATWIILFALVITGPRTKSVGFSVGISSLEYAKNQAIMLVKYIKLVFWPHPLILDYGQPFPVPFSRAAPYIVIVTSLLIVTVITFLVKPVPGFVGLWFFLVLAPSSSFVPIITEVGAERRMYLPLASIVAAVVMLGYLLLRHIPGVFMRDLRGSFFGLIEKVKYKAGIFVITIIIVSLVVVTVRRNNDYRSGISILQSSINAMPENARAYLNLGRVFESQGSIYEAIEYYQKAIRLQPNFAMAHYNLGQAFSQLNMTSLAIKHYRRSISINPLFFAAHNNLATALVSEGKIEEASEHYEKALELAPDSAMVHYNFAIFQNSLGRTEKARLHFQKALEINPDFEKAQKQLDILSAIKKNTVESQADEESQMQK